jgi:hypothetical protein
MRLGVKNTNDVGYCVCEDDEVQRGIDARMGYTYGERYRMGVNRAMRALPTGEPTGERAQDSAGDVDPRPQAVPSARDMRDTMGPRQRDSKSLSQADMYVAVTPGGARKCQVSGHVGFLVFQSIFCLFPASLSLPQPTRSSLCTVLLSRDIPGPLPFSPAVIEAVARLEKTYSPFASTENPQGHHLLSSALFSFWVCTSYRHTHYRLRVLYGVAFGSSIHVGSQPLLWPSLLLSVPSPASSRALCLQERAHLLATRSKQQIQLATGERRVRGRRDQGGSESAGLIRDSEFMPIVMIRRRLSATTTIRKHVSRLHPHIIIPILCLLYHNVKGLVFVRCNSITGVDPSRSLYTFKCKF